MTMTIRANFSIIAMAILGMAFCLATTASGVMALKMDAAIKPHKNLAVMDALATDLILNASDAPHPQDDEQNAVAFPYQVDNAVDALLLALPAADLDAQSKAVTVATVLFGRFVLPAVVPQLLPLRDQLMTRQPKVVSFLKNKKNELQKKAGRVLVEHRDTIAAVTLSIISAVVYGFSTGLIELPEEFFDTAEYWKLYGKTVWEESGLKDTWDLNKVGHENRKALDAFDSYKWREANGEKLDELDVRFIKAPIGRLPNIKDDIAEPTAKLYFDEIKNSIGDIFDDSEPTVVLSADQEASLSMMRGSKKKKLGLRRRIEKEEKIALSKSSLHGVMLRALTQLPVFVAIFVMIVSFITHPDGFIEHSIEIVNSTYK